MIQRIPASFRHRRRTARLRPQKRKTPDYANILRCAGAGIAACDPEGMLIDFNEAFCQLLGYRREALLKMSFRDFTLPEDQVREAPLFAALIQGERDDYRLEKRYRRCDGETVWVDLSVTAIRRPDGHPECVIGTIFDITARKLAEEKLNLFHSAFMSAGEAMVITDHDNCILHVNPAFERITGYRGEEVLGRDPKVLASGRTAREIYDAMWEALGNNGVWHGEIWDKRANGETYPKMLHISTIKNPRGITTHYVGSFSDISVQKNAEARISYLSERDTLTGLPNRFHFHDCFQNYLIQAKRSGTMLAIIDINLDHLARHNELLGQEGGDFVLRETGRRLLYAMRDDDLVARIGGDEFAIVATGLRSLEGVHRLVKKLQEAIKPECLFSGLAIHPSVSIGVSTFPRDGDSVESLMLNARTALEYAQKEGRGLFRLFTEEMLQSNSERLWIENELHHAIERGQLSLHYQPQIHRNDQRVIGVEALLRWQHPVAGNITPDRFIPVAEESHLIIELGAWVIDRACQQLRTWRNAGIDGLRMAINLSAAQLHDPQLVSRISSALDRYELNEGDLEVEITESVAMKNPEASILLLNSLRELGVKLAIDDFGTGYSSLSYLRRLPIDTLKVDRSFVKDIEFDQHSAAICTSTIHLAHKLGLQIVAEGVETLEQRNFLVDHGCDLIQGWFCGRPMNSGDFERWWEGHHAESALL